MDLGFGLGVTRQARLAKLRLWPHPSHHLNYLECTSFDPMSAEHGATIAVALIPLLSVQVRVVENEGGSSDK